MKKVFEFLKKRKVYVLTLMVCALFVSASKFISSGVYYWDKVRSTKTRTGWTRPFLEGSTRSLQLLKINAYTLYSGKSTHQWLAEKGTDELIIVKEGSMELIVNDFKKTINEGSIAVLSQGDHVMIQNSASNNLVYFSILFKPAKAMQAEKSTKRTVTFLSQWDTVTYSPSKNGGRRNLINQTTSSLKNLEIHVTTLKEGLPSHNAHTHSDEEIILVRKGTVEESINGVNYTAGPGSFFFLSNDDNHGIKNAGTGECEYYAIRWITGKTPAAK
jgi:uncharacterized cupin superfamily protein